MEVTHQRNEVPSSGTWQVGTSTPLSWHAGSEASLLSPDQPEDTGLSGGTKPGVLSQPGPWDFTDVLSGTSQPSVMENWYVCFKSIPCGSVCL